MCLFPPGIVGVVDRVCAVLAGRGWLCDSDTSDQHGHGSSWVYPCSEWPELEELNDTGEPYQPFTRVSIGQDPQWCADPSHEVWLDLAGAHPGPNGEGWHLTAKQLFEHLDTIEAHHPLNPDPFPALAIRTHGCRSLTDD